MPIRSGQYEKSGLNDRNEMPTGTVMRISSNLTDRESLVSNFLKAVGAFFFR